MAKTGAERVRTWYAKHGGERRAPRCWSNGFPKKLPCLVCGRPRRASWAGDRIHGKCREATLAMYESGIIFEEVEAGGRYHV